MHSIHWSDVGKFFSACSTTLSSSSVYISSLEAQLSTYGGGGSSGAGGRGNGGAGGGGIGGGGSLEESIPGTPGDDYPIYASVPDTGFTCDGQVILDTQCTVILRQGAIPGRGW